MPKETHGAGRRTPGGRRSMEFPVEVRPVESRSVEYIGHRGRLARCVRARGRDGARGRRGRARECSAKGSSSARGSRWSEIEPERYRLAVDAARGDAAEGAGGEGEAEAGYARRQAASAKNPGLIRGEEIETWRTKVQTAAAEVAQAQARAGAGEAQSARRLRARAGRRASSRPAPSRPDSTFRSARCSRRSCAAIRCCCASRFRRGRDAAAAGTGRAVQRRRGHARSTRRASRTSPRGEPGLAHGRRHRERAQLRIVPSCAPAPSRA